MSAITASVVVPAHDEGPGVRSTLEGVLEAARPDEFEVVVVCNGCTDDTAAQARAVPGVTVVEIPEASKIAALRRGDEVATRFPRVYLDADVRVSTATIRAVVGAFADPSVRVAGVRGVVDATASSRVVRWYFDFRQRLPVFRGGVIGAGLYALDEVGRSRFGAWPDVLGDDQFVLRTFAASERRLVEHHQTQVRAPRRLRDLARRQVRIRRGNRQLTRGAPAVSALPSPRAGVTSALREAAASPTAWPGAVTWLSVNAAIRVLERLPSSGDWSSSRAVVRHPKRGRRSRPATGRTHMVSDEGRSSSGNVGGRAAFAPGGARHREETRGKP